MERPTLSVKPRPQTGTRAGGRNRRQGLVPGVVYGKSTTPANVLVERRQVEKLLLGQASEHSLVTLRCESDGAPAWEKPVLVKQVQRDPVHGGIQHVDFHAIVLTEQIRIKIPLMLLGEAVGVKQDGGILEHFFREIEVECLPTEIPRQVEYEISHLKIGDTVHAKELAAPPGARITTDPDAVIVSVLTPKEEKPEEVTEAPAEPEVIREKKPEAEAEGAASEAGGKAEKSEKKEEK
ncbi:MAG: 50S ribosomal protein L25 [Candidatus Omnitrophica bacterium]|nr:50S ribosomal protein L25 [Candidatus Omnitrophota bacterium]